jgi:hypothetical protein
LALMLDDHMSAQMNKSGEIFLRQGANHSEVGHLARICNEV